MADQKKPLNLDEIYGTARSIGVIFKDRRYELVRLEALDPKQAVRFQKLQLKAKQLQSINPNEPSDDDAEQITQAVDDMLRILCADLPLADAELTFTKKTRILEYYFDEALEKKAPKLALEKMKNKTGVRSSRR